MSSNYKSQNVSGNTLMICLTSVVIVALGGICAVILAGGDDSQVLARAGIITGFVGILVPQFLLLARQEKGNDLAESVKEDTNAILNGKGQAAIEKAVHTVLESRGVGQSPGESVPMP